MRELTIKGYLILGIGILFLQFMKIILALICFTVAGGLFIKDVINQWKGRK